MFPKFEERIRRQEVINVPSLDELPADHEVERRHLKAQQIQSLLTVPISYRGKLVGFVGFDAVRHKTTFTSDDIDLLKRFSITLVNALVRKRNEQELHQTVQQMQMAVEAAQMGTWHWDIPRDKISNFPSGGRRDSIQSR